MRGLLVALALAFTAPLTLGLGACASLQGLQPQSVREALAEANIAFVGVVDVATEGVNSGLISHADAVTMGEKLDQVGDYLDTSRRLLATGDVSGANDKLALARAIIHALAVELTARAEAHARTPA